MRFKPALPPDAKCVEVAPGLFRIMSKSQKPGKRSLSARKPSPEEAWADTSGVILSREGVEILTRYYMGVTSQP